MIDLAIKAFEILRQENKESGRKNSSCHLEDVFINASYVGHKNPRTIPGETEFKVDGRWIDIYHHYSNPGLRNRTLLHDENGTRIRHEGSWMNKIQEVGHQAILKSLLGS
jgi:hypothetical protein